MQPNASPRWQQLCLSGNPLCTQRPKALAAAEGSSKSFSMLFLPLLSLPERRFGGSGPAQADSPQILPESPGKTQPLQADRAESAGKQSPCPQRGCRKGLGGSREGELGNLSSEPSWFSLPDPCLAGLLVGMH